MAELQFITPTTEQWQHWLARQPIKYLEERKERLRKASPKLRQFILALEGTLAAIGDDEEDTFMDEFISMMGSAQATKCKGGASS